MIGSSDEGEMAQSSDRQYESPKFFIGDSEPKLSNRSQKDKLQIQTGDNNDDGIHGQSCRPANETKFSLKSSSEGSKVYSPPQDTDIHHHFSFQKALVTHESEDGDTEVHQIISDKQTSDISDDELEAEDFAEDYRQKLLKYQEELQTINETQHDLANMLT